MPFRPTRVVHVTTKEALDLALASADQVIVEGDDRLLSYAAARASHDPELARVDVEIAGRSVSVGRNASASPDDLTVRAAAPGPAPPQPAAARRSNSPLFAVVAAAFALVALASGWRLISPGADRLVSAPKSAVEPPPSSAETARDGAARLADPAELAPVPPSDVQRVPPLSGAEGTRDIGRNLAELSSPRIQAEPTPTATLRPAPEILAALAWPAVAIVALFFIARQAIAGGRNVEISWKVTEKVAGRVIITKVRSRAGDTRSAA